jgi:hypothetical protein
MRKDKELKTGLPQQKKACLKAGELSKTRKENQKHLRPRS